MICNVSQIKSWVSHLASRAEEARGIGLLSHDDDLILLSAIVFVPDGMCERSLETIQPSCSLRDAQGLGLSPGWMRREDLFDDAAKWILAEYSNLDKVELFCEAGYSKQGDKILESRQHIILRDAPILNQKLSGASFEAIAKTLRWGRSWRLLGVIADMSSGSAFEGSDIERLLFICDAFDGDSILLVEISQDRKR